MIKMNNKSMFFFNCGFSAKLYQIRIWHVSSAKKYVIFHIIDRIIFSRILKYVIFHIVDRIIFSRILKCERAYSSLNRGSFKITMSVLLNICPYCRHILTLLRHDGWLSSAEFIKIHTTSGTHIIGIYS